MEAEFENEVRKIIEEYNLISERSKVIVAVSGGPDSVALLCVLNQLKEKLNIELHVAHLNHGFREKSAEEDANFVKYLAEKFKIPYTIKKWNVKKYIMKKNVSTQQGARTMRYRFLSKVAKKECAKIIALGHNKDDQVETFFMRLLRGSSPEGLSGIPTIRKLSEGDDTQKDTYIVRPLIYTSRKKIELYLKSLDQSFKIDPTNKESLYLRNKFRLELTPQLEKINPNFKNLISETMELIFYDNDYLKNEANKLYQKVKIESKKGFVKLNCSFLISEHKALVKRVLRKALIVASDKDIEKKHVDLIEELINKKIQGPIVLPGEVKVYLIDSVLIFTLEPLRKTEWGKYITRLKIPGETYWKPLDCYIKADIKVKSSVPKDDLTEKPHEAFLDYTKLEGKDINVRTRRRGDFFSPLGMKDSKKLKDYFIDCKIPTAKRDTVPIIVSEDEIIWVAPYRISDKFKVTQNTDRILHLSIICKGERRTHNDQDREARRTN